MTDDDAVLFTSDVAKVLDCTPDNVRAMVRRGTLKPTKITPRGVALFSPAAVRQLARRRLERRTTAAME